MNVGIFVGSGIVAARLDPVETGLGYRSVAVGMIAGSGLADTARLELVEAGPSAVGDVDTNPILWSLVVWAEEEAAVH